MNQLILTISLWGVTFLLSERILLLICMVLQFIRRREFLLNETYLYKTLKILIIFYTGFASFIFTFFSLYRLHSCSLCTIFGAISPEIDEVLSINPSPNVFVFEDFNVHHKKWLTTLLTWLSFPLRSLTVTLRFRLIWVCSSF